MKRAIALLCIFAASTSAQPTGKRAFTLEDWYRVTAVRQAAVSPDGRRVAFTVVAVREQENRRHSEIWIANTDGGAPRRFSSPGAESTTPRWSPDGKLLVFNSSRSGSASGLWAVRMDEPSGDAQPLDRFRAGSTSADHSLLVYSAAPDRAKAPVAADPYSGMGASRPPYGAITRPVDPKRFDGRQIVEFPFRQNDIGYNAPRVGPPEMIPTQLFSQALDGSGKRQLTATAYGHHAEAVSPDGKWVAFTADAQLRPDSVVKAIDDSLAIRPYDRVADEAPHDDTDIFVVPTEPCAAPEGCAPRRVARFTGNEFALQWSPDSKRISFLSRVGRYTPVRLHTIAVGGGAPDDLLGKWQFEPAFYFWRPDGTIVFTAEVGGRTAAFLIDPANKKITEIVGGRRRLSDFSTDDHRAKIAYVSSSVTNPTELYVADADGRNERQVTHFNDSLNAEVGWADAERFTYKSVGGREIEGWLMKPFGYQPGRKYPLVLYIHGGPHSSYTETWFDEFQSLAGAGFMVLYTNPRGSGGYGADFTYSIRGRWGDEDYQDLMIATDLMTKRPDVDSTRMGVTGGSYGGFMTGWITSHTRRFRAAEADRANMDWVSWYGGSDAAQGLTESELLGKPWENWKMYDETSPIRYVGKVRTPTLIVSSEEDYRVTIGQGDEWFVALKKQGVPVEFVRYPRSSHELSRSGEPWLLVDRLGRIRDWFNHWLKP
jgi:dipeptidyl aminopeptidase/acylaminoacyl peptidase